MAKDERTYIRVHDGIEDHPKVAALSDRAFRLLVTTWGWCSRHLTDGRVPTQIWKRRGTAAARRELVLAGLVDEHDGYVAMHDYLEHQRSAEEVAQVRAEKRANGIKGAHKRWHTERSKADPNCPQCIANGWHQPSPKPSQHPWSVDGKPMAETETETETETDLPVVTRGGGVTEVDGRATPHPPERPSENCQRHPDGTSEPCRACGDARRSARTWDVQVEKRKAWVANQLEQARRDRRLECEHGTPGGLHPHPDTGLPLCALCRARAAS